MSRRLMSALPVVVLVLSVLSIVLGLTAPASAQVEVVDLVDAVDVDVDVDVDVHVEVDPGPADRVAAPPNPGTQVAEPDEPYILTVREPVREAGPEELTVYVEPPRVQPHAVVVVHPLPVPEPREHPQHYALPYAEPERDPEPSGTFHMGLFGEELRLDTFGLGFHDPEVSAIAGGTIPLAEPWASPIAGGFMIGGGYRPLPWLRVPEFTASIGGGSADGAWVPVSGTNTGFEARLTSIFLLRAELAAGIELPMGPVRPFAMGRIGLAGYWVGADVTHGELGDLGSETLSRAAFETGFDAGVAIRVAEHQRISVSWRETFGDTRWRGLTLGYTAVFNE